MMYRFALAAATALTPLLTSTGVSAQTQPDPSPRSAVSPVTKDEATRPPETAEIIVTAQKRAQSQQDVPISITVATGKSLEEQKITNLADFSHTVANLQIGRGVGSSVIRIRGVGSGFNPGFDQADATFVDNAYRGRSKSIQASLFDVEQIEVLKGPQSTFFGNSASAGALNIVTRKPKKDLAVDATALYGTYNEYLAQLGIDIPLSNSLSVRLVGRSSGEDGYTHNYRLNDAGPHLRDLIGRASLAWKPTSDIEVDFRVDVGHSRDRGTSDGEFLNCPPGPGYPFPTSPFDVCAAFLKRYGPNFKDPNYFDYKSVASPSYLNYDFVEPELTVAIKLGDYTLTLTSDYFSSQSCRGARHPIGRAYFPRDRVCAGSFQP